MQATRVYDRNGNNRTKHIHTYMCVCVCVLELKIYFLVFTCDTHFQLGACTKSFSFNMSNCGQFHPRRTVIMIPYIAVT
ncbi:hypothetical protein JHK85_033497 [Glycine max]|uniref:Uncharacterized protein n=1 Tax=Glycine max TaxID=3847 RepID=K7LSZ9_SOYBN|nr:hypothetical protein JHK85_033497 [Glycine max]KAH1141565.1 hypothetical protein GYH30_032683 [Glycine max]